MRFGKIPRFSDLQWTLEHYPCENAVIEQLAHLIALKLNRWTGEGVYAQLFDRDTSPSVATDEMQQTNLELGDYCEFYSHLAVEARRASRVALVACGVALIAIVSAILAQLRPPILLRVQDGKVSVLNGSGMEVAETSAQQQPDESEKLAFVSGFLDHFVNIDPVTVKRNTTLALNQMTNTLRQQILAQLNEQHFVDTVRDNNVTATLKVESSELVSA